jgi:hypothetical protein
MSETNDGGRSQDRSSSLDGHHVRAHCESHSAEREHAPTDKCTGEKTDEGCKKKGQLVDGSEAEDVAMVDVEKKSGALGPSMPLVQGP